MATCRIWCSRYGRVNNQAHSPDGGAPQERQELNLHLPGFGDQVPIRWLIPINNETAPGSVPWAVALWRLGGLHGNRPSAQGSFKLR